MQQWKKLHKGYFYIHYIIFLGNPKPAYLKGQNLKNIPEMIQKWLNLNTEMYEFHQIDYNQILFIKSQTAN